MADCSLTMRGIYPEERARGGKSNITRENFTMSSRVSTQDSGSGVQAANAPRHHEARPHSPAPLHSPRLPSPV